MGQYIAMRPKLMSRQFKQRLLAEEAERQAAEDAAIMAALLIEERARKAALERVMAEDKARRLAFRPHRPPKLSQQEHAEQKIQECLHESIERGAQSTQKPLNVHLMIVEPERYLTDVKAPDRRSKRARTPLLPAVRSLVRLITLSRSPLSARPTDRRPERRAHDECVRGKRFPSSKPYPVWESVCG